MLLSEDPSLERLRKWLMSLHFTLKLDFKYWHLISGRRQNCRYMNDKAPYCLEKPRKRCINCIKFLLLGWVQEEEF